MSLKRWPAAEAVEQRGVNVSLENAVSIDSPEILAILTEGGRKPLPTVSIEQAMSVPAVFAAVNFLARLLASLPLHAYRQAADGEATRLGGDLQMLLNEAPNPEWSSFEARRYFWTQVFTHGRGMFWIERTITGAPAALWPLDPTLTTVRRQNGRKFYRCLGNEYPAADVVDVPFLLHANQLSVYSPIRKCNQAIALMIAMNEFAGTFFQGGGVPPLALEGPMPQGAEGIKRAQADVSRAIRQARESNAPFFSMPLGHTLKQLGFDPSKGQMTEARRFQIEEIARTYGLPPVFVQDLSKGTFSNTEQQDLQLSKHVASVWGKALEDELNLKLFGQRRRARYVEHNVDGLQRGDFLSRINGLARAIQTAQMTPDEARALENRKPMPNGDKLYIQGATVPLGTQPTLAAPNDNGDPTDAKPDPAES